jgi:hypothetical protein
MSHSNPRSPVPSQNDTRLAKPQTYRDSSVICEAPLTRAMKIAAALDARLQRLADMDVVIQISVAGPADPAMRLGSLATQLVCGLQTETLQLLVKGVLVREEPRDGRAVPAGDRVVVTNYEQPAAEPGRQAAEALKQRDEERLLSSDLHRGAITGWDIHTDQRHARTRVKHHTGRAPRERQRELAVQHLMHRDPAGDRYTAIAGVGGEERSVAARLETVEQQPRAITSARLGQNNHILSAASQPGQDHGGTRRCRRPDVQAQRLQALVRREADCRRATTMATVFVYGLDPSRCERLQRVPALARRTSGRERRHG